MSKDLFGVTFHGFAILLLLLAVVCLIMIDGFLRRSQRVLRVAQWGLVAIAGISAGTALVGQLLYALPLGRDRPEHAHSLLVLAVACVILIALAGRYRHKLNRGTEVSARRIRSRRD